MKKYICFLLLIFLVSCAEDKGLTQEERMEQIKVIHQEHLTNNAKQKMPEGTVEAIVYSILAVPCIVGVVLFLCSIIYTGVRLPAVAMRIFIAGVRELLTLLPERKTRKRIGYGLLAAIGLVIAVWFYEPVDVVVNSSWDGSVIQVERYLKKNLKDPKSYEMIDWSPVQKEEDGSFLVRHKYRSKNSFGGYVEENKIFYLDKSGNVYDVKSLY